MSCSYWQTLTVRSSMYGETMAVLQFSPQKMTKVRKNTEQHSLVFFSKCHVRQHQNRHRNGQLQWGTKLSGQLTRFALIPPRFPLAPKQCCSLCSPCTLNPVLKVYLHPKIVWRGEGRAIRGIHVVRVVHIMLHLII